MTAKNETRKQFAIVLLAVSTIALLLGLVSEPGWSYFLFRVGGGLLAMGVVMYISVSIINGVPWLVRLLSFCAEPAWEGEVLYGHGGSFKIRYVLDSQGRAHYVADDICSATGTKPPIRNAQQWGGVRLSLYGGIMCFPESSVQDYLLPLASKDYDANRLLLLIRNHVQRKMEE